MTPKSADLVLVSALVAPEGPADSFAEMTTRVEQSLSAGEIQLAREAMEAIEDSPRSPAEHTKLADLAERTGLLDRAVGEHNLRLALEPTHLPTLHALARLRLDQGQTERAARCLEKALEIDPNGMEAALELGRIQEQAGNIEAAISLYRRAAQHEDKRRAQLAPTRAAPAHDDDPATASSVAASVEGAIANPDDTHTVIFADLFVGRCGVYARQWLSEGGRTGYSPVREPFTPHVARRHLVGDFTVGIYPVRQDNTTHFICLDVDIAKRVLSNIGGDVGRRLEQMKQCQRFTASVQETLASVEIPSYLEDSGNKGRHLWAFFERPLPARQARLLMSSALLLHALPTELTAELFPAQSRVPKDGLGNLVKLPLGIHRLTGRRALFVNARGQPLADQLGVLTSIRRVDSATVDRAIDLLGRRTGGGPGTSAPSPPTSSPGPQRSTGDEPFGSDAHELVSEPLAKQNAFTAFERAPYELKDDVEAQRLIAGCNVVAEIVRRIEQGAGIDSDCRLVLTHTMGCLGRGADAVNELLGQVPGLDGRLLLKKRQAGQPMSCARVRKRVPELLESVDCDCELQLVAGQYASPVVHATTALPEQAGLLAQRLEVDRMVRDLVTCRAEVKRISARADQLERLLLTLMGQQEVQALQSGYGMLRCHANGKSLTIEV